MGRARHQVLADHRQGTFACGIAVLQEFYRGYGILNYGIEETSYKIIFRKRLAVKSLPGIGKTAVDATVRNRIHAQAFPIPVACRDIADAGDNLVHKDPSAGNARIVVAGDIREHPILIGRTSRKLFDRRELLRGKGIFFRRSTRSVVATSNK
jgi:hypothetical protein